MFIQYILEWAAAERRRCLSVPLAITEYRIALFNEFTGGLLSAKLEGAQVWAVFGKPRVAEVFLTPLMLKRNFPWFSSTFMKT